MSLFPVNHYSLDVSMQTTMKPYEPLDVSMRATNTWKASMSSIKDMSIETYGGVSQDELMRTVLSYSLKDVTMRPVESNVSVIDMTMRNALMLTLSCVPMDIDWIEEPFPSAPGVADQSRKRGREGELNFRDKRRKVEIFQSGGTPERLRQYQKAAELDPSQGPGRFDELNRLQKGIKGEKKALYVEATLTEPPSVLNREGVHVVTGVAGKGAESEVLFTSRLDGAFHTPEKRVVKVGNEGYTPQKIITDQLRDFPQVDPILSTARVIKGGTPKKLAFGKAAIGDITEVEFKKYHHPVKMVFELANNAIIGLQALHSKGNVHRDIKGLNILFRECAFIDRNFYYDHVK